MALARTILRRPACQLRCAVATSSSAVLPCRRSSSSAVAAAAASRTSRDVTAAPRRTVRKLPSLKVDGIRVRTPSGSSSSPSVDSLRRAPESARPTAVQARAASPSRASRPSTTEPPAQLLDPLRRQLDPDLGRDESAIAEMSEESRLLATVKKKALRKYEDAFWSKFMQQGQQKPPTPVPLPKARSPEPRPSAGPLRKPARPASSPARRLFRFHDHLSYYATLGFAIDAFDDLPEDETLRVARVHLQTTAHPDVPGGDAALSSRINQAFDALSTLDKRKRYQAQGARAKKS